MKLNEFMELVISQARKNEKLYEEFKNINFEDYIDKDNLKKLVDDIKKIKDKK